MRALKSIGKGFLVLLILLAAAWILGPREPADLTISFDPMTIGDDPAAYLSDVESEFDDITPGVEKQIIWADAPGQKTPWAIVYIHGFSATAQEIRPVPDLVADGLAANLYYTRLTGHGRSGEAMAEASVNDWVNDMVEALEIGQRIGERTIVLSTSTGSPLVTLAALQPDFKDKLAGVVFVSPNFDVADPKANILTYPFARQILPKIFGETRTWEPRSAAQETYWSTSYPTVALLPMMALVKQAQELDLALADLPGLFIWCSGDQVISSAAVQAAFDNWGGRKQAQMMTPEDLGPDDDPYCHVISGDIMSPAQTEVTVQAILNWANEL